MKRLLYILAYLVMVAGLLFLAGCASTPPIPREVLVPVDRCTVPALPARPILPVGSLTDDTTYDEKEKAYVISLDLITTYAAGLEAQLKQLAAGAKK